MLYKIEEIYSRYNLNDEDRDTLYTTIDYYSSRDSSDDSVIQKLVEKCNIEWQKLLIKICEDLINTVEYKKDYLTLLKIELKQVNIIYFDVKNGKKLPDEYEKIFDEQLDKLKDNVEVKIYDKDFDKKISNNSLLYGSIIGVIISIIVGILFYYLGFV